MTEDFDRMLHESPEHRQEQLSAALDAMLSADEQAALDAHLAGCETCTRELEELRQVRMLLRAMPQPALPRSFLLPAEGELVAPGVPAPAEQRRPAPNVTPLRQPGRRASRTLSVTCWVGTLAAVLGLALFLGTLLPGLTSQGGAYSTSAPAAAQNGSSNSAVARTATHETNPSPTNSLTTGGEKDQSATATARAAVPAQVPATPTVTLAYTSPAPSMEEILRVVAFVLLFGGVALAMVSLVVARRI